MEPPDEDGSIREDIPDDLNLGFGSSVTHNLCTCVTGKLELRLSFSCCLRDDSP